MTSLDTPRVSDEEYHRIRHLVGLDRTYVANRCPDCSSPLVYEFDRNDAGDLRAYLDCHCGHMELIA